MERPKPAPADEHAWRHWAVGWLGAAGIRVANASIHQATSARRLSEPRVHQLSMATLTLGIAQRFHALQRRHPIPRMRTAVGIGATWAALTIGLELAMGRLVSGKPWEELLADYDVRKGRVRPVVLVWMLIGPDVMRRLKPPGDRSES